MRRVVITGMGITSCLGNDLDTVSSALREGRAGIRHLPDHAEAGLRSHVGGNIELDLDAQIDRKVKRFMSDASAYAYIAMRDAIADAGMDEAQVANPRTGLIAGSGGGSSQWQVESADILRARGVRKVGPYMVPRTMCSTVSACLATAFQIKGLSYSLSAACATSAHCIGAAADLIRHGAQDVMFAGGGEDLHWSMSVMFDAMGALSTRFNETPASASRPYDKDRDGFVIAGGGGMLVLEDYDHAVARGARIHAELVGYGVTSDGADMVAPSGEGAVRCMNMAMEHITAPIDYLNTHGTSTPLGDVTELKAVREVFGESIPPLSSTKALSGHSLGAASVHEAIYCLLMMRDGFIAGSANIGELDPLVEGFPIVQQTQPAQLNTVMSNSFGFGGTNAALVFSRI
ncbi:beta-ketoacyl-ACP synthase I [Stenotrophomonas sp. JAI102]|uniref:beta-ketoacyl-ACP synthase I n=1 Tax=Stenotrophomonas sp. JAI102 TaxID=2723077 RepID=UPI0015CC1AD3|nr:beta-ketoacyl-ACP synthase I [Stenotrophomonas sp. JAI102]NYF37760.1 3-oxoacyl-[acyl-carrier-protein] synthase-1 [Stenotrophomonas sp. JAI102]